MNPVLSRRVLFVAAAGVLASGLSVAQPPGRSGPGSGMMGPGMMGGGMMGGEWNTASYLDRLKAQLGITAAQEPAWKAYADTVAGVGGQMQALHQTMFESMGTATWEERRTQMNQMFEARQQAYDTVHEAAGKLLPVLDPAQRGKAEWILPGLRSGHGMMRLR